MNHGPNDCKWLRGGKRNFLYRSVTIRPNDELIDLTLIKCNRLPYEIQLAVLNSENSASEFDQQLRLKGAIIESPVNEIQMTKF